ncbi:MAG: S24 family peptidase [Candidatus Saccharimonadales bacterium]
MDDVWSKLVALAGQLDIDEMTLGEMASRLGLKHRSQARHYKVKAEQDGLLVRNSLGRLVPAPSKDNPSMITLPVMGAANCGPASLYATDQISGTINLSPSAFRRRLKEGSFAVKAIGDSMNNASVNDKTLEDGDFAVIEPASWGMAADGDYILSVIDEVANIKKLRLDPMNQRIILKSESREFFEDIVIHADDLYMYTISGKVVDVIKKRAEVNL